MFLIEFLTNIYILILELNVKERLIEFYSFKRAVF